VCHEHDRVLCAASACRADFGGNASTSSNADRRPRGLHRDPCAARPLTIPRRRERFLGIMAEQAERMRRPGRTIS